MQLQLWTSAFSHLPKAIGGSLIPSYALTNHDYHRFQNPSVSKLLIKCAALTKQTDRFLSTLATTAAEGDEAAMNRLIKKFVASSPKSTTLNVLSHLLSPDSTHPRLSSIALSLYSRITETSWFVWNPKLIAELVAVLDKNGQFDHSENLISETVLKLGSRERELVLFFSQLIESHSKQKSIGGFDNSYTYLSQLLHKSSSIYVKRRAYESMVSGLCYMDRPREAENLVEEMRSKGFNPSAFEYRSILHGYGRLGLFRDVDRSLEQMGSDGITIDTVSANMILSSYGAHNKLAEMTVWIRKMKTSSIPFSVRTYNSVLNSCTTIMLMLQETDSFPLSIGELCRVLEGDEALLIEELVGSSLLEEVMVWDNMEVKLDLHGMHLGASYLIMLQWLKEMHFRFEDGKGVVPAEVMVVCGSGKHSSSRGESPLKVLVKKMMVRMKSPMKIDRKNIGCFVAKGKVVKNWLLTEMRTDRADFA